MWQHSHAIRRYKWYIGWDPELIVDICLSQAPSNDFDVDSNIIIMSRRTDLYHYLTLSQSFQPMAAQLSLKAALPSAKSLRTASYPSGDTEPRAVPHKGWLREPPTNDYWLVTSAHVLLAGRERPWVALASIISSWLNSCRAEFILRNIEIYVHV